MTEARPHGRRGERAPDAAPSSRRIEGKLPARGPHRLAQCGDLGSGADVDHAVFGIELEDPVQTGGFEGDVGPVQ
jgi:hypothetical protein